jgi:exopolyphosphatase
MRSINVLSTLLVAAAVTSSSAGRSTDQIVLGSRTTVRKGHTGVGHFSEWSRSTKKEFLMDWQDGKASEWVMVMGNEGGDLDSITSALTWAYHLEHKSQNTSDPIKAIALLQTPSDQLDLRPENTLALDNSDMSSEHRDLLNINELPEDVETLSRKLKGIVLVDHPEPLRRWDDAKILSLFDHHKDSGAAPDANPRIFEKVASCTTIVARQMLDELEELDEEYHMPHELLQLILGAISIDSSGLDPEKSSETDKQVSKRILARSRWNDKDLEDVMEDLDDELGDAKKDLDHMGLRDLLRRDWKGDFVDTPSERTPTVHLGFASIPISLDEQIERTEWEEIFNWFVIHAAWTAEVATDISVALNKHKVKDPDTGEKKKIREIVLVVRDDIRVDDEQADELFNVAKRAIEEDKNLNVKPWHNADRLGKRQMVWTHEFEDGGRKYVRPLVEAAVKAWD